MEDRKHKRRRLRERRKLLHLITLLVVVLAVVLIVAFLPRNDGHGGTDQTHSTPPNVSSNGKLELKLLGDPVVTLEYGSVFTDEGAEVCYAGEIVDVPVQITGEVDTAKLGEYVLSYSVTYKNRTVSLNRTVRMVDTQPPIITLLDDPDYIPEIGEEYAEEGFKAEDGYDGDITANVSWHREGDVIYYSVSDSSGNTTTAERQLIFGDSTAPQIILLGDSTVTINAGSEFSDPGYSALDNVDGDLTANVTVSGSYDKYHPGTYTYTYTVTDAHGNTATAQRKIVVKGMKQPDTVDPNGKVIYLTFDDGPSKYTPELLKILKKYNIKATFFVVGNARLEYLDDIVNDGHTIAIHTDTHEYSDIYSSVDAYIKDLNAVKQKIYDRTGIACTLFRFPGGSANSVSKKYCEGIMSQLTQMLPAMGYQYCDWNVDSRDAAGATTTEEVYQNVINGIKGKDVAYVLQHDIKGYSVDAVERIIQWGLANGYTFLPLDETSPMYHQNIKN